MKSQSKIIAGIATLCIVAFAATPKLCLGAFFVEDFHSTGTISTLAEADNLIAGNGVASSSSGFFEFIDFRDLEGGGDDGNFSNNIAFPNNSAANDNDFAIRATATVILPVAGDWTFGTNSDDGVRLRVNGGNVIVDDSIHAPEDRFGTVNLGVGSHTLDLVFFERGGSAGVELFAAQGGFSSFAGNGFQLVGDTANGGLATAAVPEPQTYLMFFTILFGAGFMAIRSRRRGQIKTAAEING